MTNNSYSAQPQSAYSRFKSISISDDWFEVYEIAPNLVVFYDTRNPAPSGRVFPMLATIAHLREKTVDVGALPVATALVGFDSFSRKMSRPLASIPWLHQAWRERAPDDRAGFGCV